MALTSVFHFGSGQCLAWSHHGLYVTLSGVLLLRTTPLGLSPGECRRFSRKYSQSGVTSVSPVALTELLLI